MSEQQKKRCFVITPIGGDTDPIRRHIDGIINAAIRPALESEYEIVVAHEIMDPGSITKQIITEIYKDELVVANLTNRNPNVMYELALRHCLGKPVVMIAEKGTDLPADIIMERTIFYQNDALGTIELRDKLKQTVGGICFDQTGSPIHDVLHDIDATDKLLAVSKEAMSGENESNDALRYILHKLNRIESKLQTSRLMPQTEKFPREVMYVFTYAACDEDISGVELVRDLELVMEKEPHMRVLGCSIQEEVQEVRIIARIDDLIDVPRVYDYFGGVLVRRGFHGVKPKRQI